MEYFLLFIWLFVLPIVLPIVFGVKYKHSKEENKRIKHALADLYGKGKITKKQYVYCVQEMPPLESEIERERALSTKASNLNQSELSAIQVKQEILTVAAHADASKPDAESFEAIVDASKTEAETVISPKRESQSEAEIVAVLEDGVKPQDESVASLADASKLEVESSEAPADEPKSDAESAEVPAYESQTGVASAAVSEDRANTEDESVAFPTDASKPEVELAETPADKFKPKDKPAISSKDESNSQKENIEKQETESEPEQLAARHALEDKSSFGSPMIPIPAILGLGVILICTAGAAYISSFWGTASNIVKLIAVGSFSLIFYGAFRLAHNKLQIEHSAKAFYILCIAALGITATAAELFGLIMGNASPAAMMLLPCVVIAAGMFRGYYIFKSKLFPILGISFVFLFLTALSSAIFDAHAMMFFIPAIVSTVGFAFAMLSKKESATELRKPALVLFLVFTCLLMLSSFALDEALHKNLMTTFALSLAILMHIHLHKEYNRFIEFSIPIALCWASLTFIHTVPEDACVIALSICYAFLSASTVAAFISMRRYDKSMHPITIVLYALSIGIISIAGDVYSAIGAHGYALFLPALTFIILGAHWIQHADVESALTQEKAGAIEKSETEETDKAIITHFFSDHSGVSAWIALIAGGLYILVGYHYIEHPLAEELIWYLNLGISAALLGLALVPERFGAGDIYSRRYTSFTLLILLALGQFFIFEYSSESSVLISSSFNQSLFLIPAFVLALLERRNALRTDRRIFAIVSHISIIAIILWFVPLVMLILNDMLSDYLIGGLHLNLADYIIPVDSLLLAGILMYEPKVPFFPKAGKIRLSASAVLIGIAYISLVHTIGSLEHVWYLNLGTIAALLAIALVQARFLTCDRHNRRCMSFILMILFALYQFYIFKYGLKNTILDAYPFNQILFLVPAFVLAFIERANAQMPERSHFAIALHCSAVAVVLWFVPLVMLILNVYLSKYTIWGMSIDLSHYILPIDTLLLAIIMLYEPPKPLCPKQSIIRLGASAVLIGLSYIYLSNEHDNNLQGDTTLIRVIPWIAAALYLTVILFYTFRKKIAHADAPHLRLRGATALCTTMSLAQLGLNERIAAVLLIPALALTILDDRRSAKLKDSKGQMLSAIIGSILFMGLIALLVIKIRTIFNVESETENAVQNIALSGTALLFSLIVLAEHLLMHKHENRPYRLVTAVDLELTAACALIYILVDWPSDLPVRVMLLATGLIGTWCMSYREHRKYGQMTAVAVFVGLYALLKTGWNHLEITQPDYFVWIATAALTAVLAFMDGFKQKGITNLRLVWLISAIPLIIVRHDPYHIAHLAGVLIVAINLLQYLRERGHCDHDRILITISTGIIAVATTLKIMLLPDDAWLPVMIRPELIFLIPIMTLYLDSYLIWKFRNYSHDICCIAALIGLPLVYLIPDTHVQFHAITVTVLAIIAIIVAIRTKLNRYLAIGIVNIAIIFFSQTKNFWFNLHWWVYLAVVGVVLLAIAVLNETERRKGSTLLQLIKGLIARSWKW